MIPAGQAGSDVAVVDVLLAGAVSEPVLEPPCVSVVVAVLSSAVLLVTAITATKQNGTRTPLPSCTANMELSVP